MNTKIDNLNINTRYSSQDTQKRNTGIFSRVKNWTKENITGTKDEFVRDTPIPGSAKDKARIGVSVAGSAASLSGAAGKEILSGRGVPQDKMLHSGGTFAVTVTLGALGLPPFLAAAVTFVTASVGKELIFDGLLGKGCVDIRDVAANMCGSLAGYAALKKLKMGNISPEIKEQAAR